MRKRRRSVPNAYTRAWRFASRSPAAMSVSCFLQKAKRTSFEPPVLPGRKKLEPGTGATPTSLVSHFANSTSPRSLSAEKSAST